MSIQAISARLHQEGVEHRVVIARDTLLDRADKMITQAIRNSLAMEFGVDVDKVTAEVDAKDMTKPTKFSKLFIINTGAKAIPGVRFTLWYDDEGVWHNLSAMYTNWRDAQPIERFTNQWFTMDLLGSRSIKRGVNISNLVLLLKKLTTEHVENAFEHIAKKAKELLGEKSATSATQDIYKEIVEFEDKLHNILEGFVGKKASVEAIQKALQTKLVIKGKYKPSQLGVAHTGVGNIKVVWAYRTDKGIETKKSYILGVVKGKITEVNG